MRWFRLRHAASVVVLAMIVVLHSCGTLEPHADLLVTARPVKPDSPVSVTYLGCNGFLIRSDDETILVDPCFTRPGALRVGLNQPIPPDAARIDAGLRRANLPDRVDAILVTHAHYDHLLDVPAVQARFGGVIIASPTGGFIARASGTEEGDIDAVLPGDRRRVRGVTIRVLEAAHDRFCGRIPYEGRLSGPPSRPPSRPSDFVCGQPLAFLIGIGGKTIYVDSGGRPEVLPAPVEDGIDLALIGAALPDSRRRFVPTVERLRPRLVYPSHQDNFFRSVNQPYRFNAGTDFPALRREFEKAGTGAELILFDFFQTLRL